MKVLVLASLCLLWSSSVRADQPGPCSRADLEKVLKDGEAADLWQMVTADGLAKSKCAQNLPIRVSDILSQYTIADPSSREQLLGSALDRARDIVGKVCSQTAMHESIGLEPKKSLGVLFDACGLKKLQFASRSEFVDAVPGKSGWEAIPGRWGRLAGVVVFQALLDAGVERPLARSLGRAISGIAQLGFAEHPKIRVRATDCVDQGRVCAAIVRPIEGDVMGGEAVEIVGRGLAPGLGKIHVAFGANSVRQVLIGSKSIYAITPSGTEGSVDVALDFEDGSRIKLPYFYRTSKPSGSKGPSDTSGQQRPRSKEGLYGLRAHSGPVKELSEEQKRELARSLNPPVRSDVIRVFGPIEVSNVNSVLGKGRDAIEHCLGGPGSDYSGRMIGAVWDVSQTGQVTGLKVDRIGGKNDKFEACISDVVSGWHFDKPYNGYAASVMVLFRVR